MQTQVVRHYDFVIFILYARFRNIDKKGGRNREIQKNIKNKENAKEKRISKNKEPP